MELDLAQLDNGARNSDLLRANFCIIGGGIAGLTLAHKLTSLGQDVLLLEAGGRTRASFQAIQQLGHPHSGTLETRPRALGGTSLTWGGQLLPFPVGETSWPIAPAKFEPHSREAEQLLAVNNHPYDAPNFFAQTREPVPPLLEQLPGTQIALSKFAPFSYRNLANTLGRKLRAHSKARIALHAEVAELLLAPSRDRIDAVLVRTPTGQALRITAEHFILAAGTVESVRLLLASRSITPQGIGNQHDQLGRNFHDHLTLTAATLHGPARQALLSALRPWIFKGKPRGRTTHSPKLVATAALQQQLGILPVLAHLILVEPETSGIAALRTLLRARQQRNLAPGLASAIPHIPRAVADAVRLAQSARQQHRRYVSPQAIVQLRLNAAQRTPSASRLTLSPDGKLLLHWRIDPAELTTLRAFAHHLRSHLTPDGIAWNPALFEGDLAALLPGLDDARHPMGGACMGTDPQTSVVDPNLRVHGLHNLFIASAAVFPSGSPQLPTLPLMALTLRLAHHLAALTR